MKKILILLALTGCSGSHFLKSYDMEVAHTICANNGGLLAVQVSIDAYRAYCINGAEFFKNKGERP